MKPVNYFLDAAFLSTNNVDEYKKEKLLHKLAQFHNEIIKIEDKFLFEGARQKIINIPIKNNFICKCLMHPPSLDAQLTNSFYKIFNIIEGKYMIECNIDFECEQEQIYENKSIPPDIEKEFNDFLDGCIKSRNPSCICEDFSLNVPVFITEKTILKNNKKFVPFKNPNDLKRNFPILAFYPSLDDDDKIKEKKIKFLIEIHLIKKGINIVDLIDSKDENEDIDDPLNSKLQIMDEFWESDLIVIDNQKYKEKLIETISELVADPISMKNRMHKLNHEFVEINGKKKKLDQVDIFQEFRIDGYDIYPRLLFSIIKGKIYFYKIINRH